MLHSCGRAIFDIQQQRRKLWRGSIDNHGIGDGRNVPVPSFAVQGGIGEGLVGFGLRLFASEAAGRFSSLGSSGKPVADLGADRQALDLLLNVRPFAPAWTDAGETWTARFVRALAVDLGVAAERVSLGTKSIMREGFVAGAHISVPVVRSVDGSELFVAPTGGQIRANPQRSNGSLEGAGITDGTYDLYAALGGAPLDSLGSITVSNGAFHARIGPDPVQQIVLLSYASVKAFPAR